MPGPNQSAKPLLYDHIEAVQGKNFAAFVRIAGRALLDIDSYETSILAIEPGGFGGGGEDLSAAFQDFKSNLIVTLHDLANEADSFETFHQNVDASLAPARDELQDEWSSAKFALAAGEVDTGGLPTQRDHAARGMWIVRVELNGSLAQRPPRKPELAIPEAA